MAYAYFSNSRYDYFTENNYILFSSDNTHNDLFQYAATDMSYLSRLFKLYIRSKINTTTFELRNSKISDRVVSLIIKKLKSIHPYYKYEYKKAIIEIIGNYFNELLIYQIYNERIIDSTIPLQKNWYHDKFTWLMSSFIKQENWTYPEGSYPDDFYTKYQNWAGDTISKTEDSEIAILSVPKTLPSVFSSELESHRIICAMLYFILDTSASDLNELSIYQRIWFYSILFSRRDRWNQTQITKCFSFIPPTIYEKNEDYSQNVEYNRRLYDIFDPICNLESLDQKYENLSIYIPESFQAAIEHAKEYDSSDLYEKYKIHCIRELLLQEIISMIHSNTKIKKCKNCKKYFVSNKANQKYCNRLFENTGKPCSKIGKSRSYQKTVEKDQIRKLYKAVYQKHYSAIRSDIHDSRKKFVNWSQVASDKYKEFKNNELSSEDFIKWLFDTTPNFSRNNEYLT